MQEMLEHGVLTFGTHNMGYAHDDTALTQLFSAYDQVLPLIVTAIRCNNLHEQLRCQPLQPLFKVR